MSAPDDRIGASAPIAAAGARLALCATAGAAAIVPLAYFPPLEAPFIAPKMALLEVAAALAFVAVALHRAGRPGARLFAREVLWGMGLVLATTLASWVIALQAGDGPGAPYAPAAVARWCALFGLAGGAAIVARDPEARGVLFDAATMGAAIVAAIGLFQHFEIARLPIPVISAPGSTFGNRNFGGETMALSLPLGIAALERARARPERRGFAGVLAGAILLEVIYLVATRTRGAWLGAAAGVATLFASWRPRLSRQEAAAVLVALALVGIAWLAPGPRSAREMGDAKRSANGVEVAESTFDPQSTAFHMRVAIWRRSLQMWREHPIWGVGPGNWLVWFPRYAEPGARRDGVLTATLVARQAHDDLLERGGETGVAGVLSLLALAVAVARAARRRMRASEPDALVATAAGAGVLAALVGCGITGFPLDMPGTLTLAGLGLGLCAGETRQDGEPAGPWRGLARPLARGLNVALSGTVLVIAVVAAQQQLRGSYWLGTAIRDLRRDLEVPSAVEAWLALEKAKVLAPGNYHVWLRRAHTDLRIGRPQDAEQDARRAIAIEPWAPNAWATLASAQIENDDPRAAAESARHALSLMADLPQALLALAEATGALGDPDAAAIAHDHLKALSITPSPDRKTTEEAAFLVARLDYRSVGAYDQRARGTRKRDSTSREDRALNR